MNGARTVSLRKRLIREQQPRILADEETHFDRSVVTAPPPLPPPGWYPDPNGAPAQRYFDGTKWTDQLAPLSTPMPAYSPVMNGAVPPPRSAAVAGLLQLFLGTFGVGRFYIGTTGLAALQLVLGLVGLFFTLFCFIGVVILVPLWIWTFIEAILMFARQINDSYGRKLQ
jgi:TM2 domain-containing membrane protein YozV